VQQVYSTCGPEQEYFLIDSGYFRLRPDLQLTGRTLVGAPSPKGQQLEDHYFGSIKNRILNYMNDVTEQAYKLGIPLTTRHNEVAPHQFEFAPVFERSNIAADHNLLLMDLMKRVAERHGLECLLHEKPFSGINGSGKHLNWSMADNRGNNLLDPGENPGKNLLFLTVLVAVINAVHSYADLLRVSVASAGNEHRLGAYEAPPAIISVYLGSYLTGILENIEKGEKINNIEMIQFGVHHLPSLIRDTTDRNRTSPFAFTGDKFEFRALGSSFNISTGVTIINAIVADSCIMLCDKIRKNPKKGNFPEGVLKVLSDTLKECKSIIFNGNNYAEEWKNEAKQRGLPNEPSTPRALKAIIAEKNIALLERMKTFYRPEIEARYHTRLDLYNKTLEIEGRTLLEMVQTQILPAAYDFQTNIGQSLDVLRELATDDTIPIPTHAVDDRKEMFGKLSSDIYYIRKDLFELTDALKRSERMDVEDKSYYFYDKLKPLMVHIKSKIDDLESMMPDDLWLLPKYREMLFIN
jgi:glutamine synthetase